MTESETRRLEPDNRGCVVVVREGLAAGAVHVVDRRETEEGGPVVPRLIPAGIIEVVETLDEGIDRLSKTPPITGLTEAERVDVETAVEGTDPLVVVTWTLASLAAPEDDDAFRPPLPERVEVVTRDELTVPRSSLDPLEI